VVVSALQEPAHGRIVLFLLNTSQVNRNIVVAGLQVGSDVHLRVWNGGGGGNVQDISRPASVDEQGEVEVLVGPHQLVRLNG
jgi:hypothetical protein